MYFTSVLFPFIMFYIANLIMYIIYIKEIPFFERYRIWPEVILKKKTKKH